jgi:hypothetical protein
MAMYSFVCTPYKQSLLCSLVTPDQTMLPNPDPSWISAKTWTELGKLSAVLEAFGTLQGHMALSKVCSGMTGWSARCHE